MATHLALWISKIIGNDCTRCIHWREYAPPMVLGMVLVDDSCGLR